MAEKLLMKANCSHHRSPLAFCVVVNPTKSFPCVNTRSMSSCSPASLHKGLIPCCSKFMDSDCLEIESRKNDTDEVSDFSIIRCQISPLLRHVPSFCSCCNHP